MKNGSSSPNLSKLARAFSFRFMKTRSLCRTVYSMNGFQVMKPISLTKTLLAKAKDQILKSFSYTLVTIRITSFSMKAHYNTGITTLYLNLTFNHQLTHVNVVQLDSFANGPKQEVIDSTSFITARLIIQVSFSIFKFDWL